MSISKNVFCIRHGQAFHNIYVRLFGRDIYYDKKNKDTHLTEEGKKQALKLGENWDELDKIELVITSSLTRCLETTTNIFKNTNIPIIAFEYAREYPMGLQYCNMRSEKSKLQKNFPNINFSNLGSEQDLMWDRKNYETMDELNFRKKEVIKFIKTRSEKNIALVSHSSFLMNFLYNYLDEDEDKELNHCYPYLKVIEETDFEKHKESSF
tara:strand:+ start:3004 stop:3633 length:630 start_codon:yes stop_codon:yes gene_type:complete